MNELKRINFETAQFESNGHKYFIAPLQLPYPRLKKFLEMQPKVMHGIELEEGIRYIYNLYLDMKQGEDVNYKQSFLETYTSVHDFCSKLEGYNPSKVVEQNLDMYYEFCTLFIIREGEDFLKYDTSLAVDKIKDWKTDIYPRDFFFAVFSRLNSLTEEYDLFMENVRKVPA